MGWEFDKRKYTTTTMFLALEGRVSVTHTISMMKTNNLCLKINPPMAQYVPNKLLKKKKFNQKKDGVIYRDQGNSKEPLHT